MISPAAEPASPTGGQRAWGAVKRSGRLLADLFVGAGREFSRRRRLVLGASAAALLAGLAIHPWDRAIVDWFVADRSELGLAWARNLSRYGELHFGPLLALVAIALAGWLLRRRVLGLAALSGLLGGLTGGIGVNIFKAIFGRPRPSVGLADAFHWFETTWNFGSFPSGHATHCTAVVCGVAMVAPRLGACLAVPALAVIWSRVYLERHFPTDVLAGVWLGAMCGCALGLAARHWLEKNPAPHDAGR